MLSTSFCAKTPTFYSDKVLSWQEPRVFCTKIDFFFSCKIFFHFFLEPVYMLFINFRTKRPKLYSGQNSWLVRPRE